MRLLVLRGLFAIIAASTIVGCGSGPAGAGGSPGAKVADPVTDQAQSVKSMVSEIQRGLKEEGIGNVEGSVDALLESVEPLDPSRVGKNKATFDELVSLGKELKSAVSQNPDRGKVESLIQKMVTAADKLPGAPVGQ